MTHLHNVFLEDPIKTQLTHGVDRLPFLGFLGSHQQIGDFYGREWISLSGVVKAHKCSQPMSAEPGGLLNTHLCIVGSVIQYIFIEYFIPASRSSQLITQSNQSGQEPSKESYNLCSYLRAGMGAVG